MGTLIHSVAIGSFRGARAVCAVVRGRGSGGVAGLGYFVALITKRRVPPAMMSSWLMVLPVSGWPFRYISFT